MTTTTTTTQTTDAATIATATDAWAKAAEGGFAPRFVGDESEATTDAIFAAYEDGRGIAGIAADLGLSVASIKSRMLSRLLREMYATETTEHEQDQEGTWDDETGSWVWANVGTPRTRTVAG